MVFVSHMAYGTLTNDSQPIVNRRGPRVVAALAGTVILAVACLAFVAFQTNVENKPRIALVQRVSDDFLFKTPTLKSLVGTFMTEQGAKPSDIAEVDHYYSSKKAARIQMLDDLSSEFDPITDADSNYGRVLSLKGISRTNGPVAEDMDTTAEDKAQLQSLAWKPSSEVIGAAFQPVLDVFNKKPEAARPEPASSAVEEQVDGSQPREEVGLADSGKFGTDQVYIGQADGAGQSTKAPTQQLWGDQSKLFDLQSGRRPFLKDIRSFRKQNKDWLNSKPTYWNKAAKVQMLDDLSSEFDPFTDADSNYGRVLSLQSISRTNGPVAEDMDTSGEFKAARAQQLYSLPAPFRDHAATGVAPLADAGTIGTNEAFLYKKMTKDGQWFQGAAGAAGAGAGRSAKGRVEMLLQPARFSPHRIQYENLPEAGALGTNVAFLKKDGSSA